MHQTPITGDKGFRTSAFVWKLMINTNALEYMIINFWARCLKRCCKKGVWTIKTRTTLISELIFVISLGKFDRKYLNLKYQYSNTFLHQKREFGLRNNSAFLVFEITQMLTCQIFFLVQ